MLKLFGKRKSKNVKNIRIQATIPEGASHEIIIESMLTGRVLNTSIPGTINAYTTYEGQVAETYRKYNGFTSFGNQQTRAVVDLRTAFIAGEGISVSCEDERTGSWIEDFIFKNCLDGNNFIKAVKGSEMAGQSLLLLRLKEWTDGTNYIKISRIPYNSDVPYKPVYADVLLKEDVIDILVKRDGQWISFGFPDFIYIRTGGDDLNIQGPVTKIGVILTDLENYDRAIKDMRRNNHIFARITPTFETKTASESKELEARLNDLRWQIGTAFIGTAKMKYETPSGGAHENLNTELASTVKTISSVTGIPVHWIGWVDLMSNRSTAETLYELIKNATINERVEWQNAIYNLIYKAQEMYIDTGGTELGSLNPDYQIVLPLLDFGKFVERVRGLSLAYGDQAISIDDYRNAIPGIDPMKTKKAVEKEKEEAEKEMIRMGENMNIDEEEDEDE